MGSGSWSYKEDTRNEFIVPVESFRTVRSYVAQGWVYMNSVGVTEYSSSEIVHEDGHIHKIEWTGPGHLRFNLDKEGNIDSYQIDSEIERMKEK